MPTSTPAAHSVAFSPVADLAEVTASVLKNKFGEVARLAAAAPLAVSRHNRREFVLLSAAQYEEFQQSRLAPLKTLAADFDRMVEKMNTPEDRAGRASFFEASAVKKSPALAKLKKQRADAR